MNTLKFIEERLGDFIDHTYIRDDNETVIYGKRLIGSMKDLKVHIYPDDHNPPHFHVISESRKINARFTIEPIEYLSDKGRRSITKSDIKKIKAFFERHSDLREFLHSEYKRFNLRK